MAEEEEEFEFHEVSHGTTVEWEIKKFLDRISFSGDDIQSREFWESGICWQISLYPSGKKRDCAGYISLFLANTTVGACPFKALVTFSLKVGDILLSSKTVNYTFKLHESCGYLKFLERSAILKHMKPASSSQSLTVVCTIRSRDLCYTKTVSTQTSLGDGVNALAQSLEELFLTREFFDVKIKVGPEEFQAHKLILIARSPVFASMFHHKMTESISGTIEISDCDPKIFEDFLSFLYTCKTEKVCYKKALSLYKIADKYCVKDLKELCRRRIIQGMDIDSICEVLELAAAYEGSELLQTATEFFISNADKVLGTATWLNFLSERTTLANEFLRLLLKRSLTIAKSSLH